MAKKDFYTYEYAKSFLRNKDRAITTFINNTLDKLQEMFIYDGLPDTLPQSELERMLLTNGHAFITEIDGKIYALSGTLGGEVDEYNRPKLYTVANVALNLSRTFDIASEGVLVKNDYNMMGVMPIIYKYGALLVEAELTLNSGAILSRIQMLISAPDDKTKASAELFLDKINNGDYSVIGENAFFEGVRLQHITQGSSRYITQFIELVQYYKASFFHEIGLNSNYNMKRERLNVDEVAMNIDALLPFADNMFHCRLNAVKAINELYGLNVVVDYNSAWKTTHEERDKITQTVITDTSEIIQHEAQEAMNEIVETEPDNEGSEENEENKRDIHGE